MLKGFLGINRKEGKKRNMTRKRSQEYLFSNIWCWAIVGVICDCGHQTMLFLVVFRVTEFLNLSNSPTKLSKWQQPPPHTTFTGVIFM
ncbi:hypothetical protein ES332_D05G246600v1 [Gossypium tomentosum]|uniref:Uncharacterized protein n=1 Tax=Gossypium tomentosum TaxID=34277 RepID=A0A5D2KYY1_GOSTO|nr:hypothetical protein ES332_D05G246600v1 [Gossypium tomentosum]TYH72319.1 hypothetical protein ES332_D05G246600v1 [Gossypium tomentosum]